MMKRLFSILMVSMMFSGVGFALLPASASAGDLIPNCGDTGSSICDEVNQNQEVDNNRFYGPNGLLTRVAALIMYIGGVAAVIMIVLGGFTFITGSGDPNALAAAKKTVLYAVVGIIVIVMPTAIIQFVLSRL
jgi:uncharacterized ferredoxin-like protein